MPTIWEEMRRMQRRMDKMFEELFSEEPFGGKPRLTDASKEAEKQELMSRLERPLSDIWETDKEIKAEIDIPGVDKKDISVNVTDHMLEVKAERKQEQQKEEKGVHRFERSYAGFYRSFWLPYNADTSQVDCKYENGVVKITIPKRDSAEQKPRQIDVK